MGYLISWHVELAVKPGQLVNFRELTGEMVESTRAEPGVLSYQNSLVTTAGSCMPMSAMRIRPRRWRTYKSSENSSAAGSWPWWTERNSRCSVIRAMS